MTCQNPEMNGRGQPGEHRAFRGPGPALDRRRFLLGAAATGAGLALAGCGGSSGSDGSGGTGPAARHQVRAAAAPRPAGLDGPAFTLGVASGDPLTDSVVLWTRLAVDPEADDGAGGMGPETVKVAWDLATDADFAHLVASDTAMATADHAHSVHVIADGLEAGTAYWYRFRLGDEVSTVGRTSTLPDGSPTRYGIAITNCQMYESAAYGAWRHLADERIDLVAFLGDYIYEYPGGTGEGRHSLPNRMVSTLGDYRLRYASYKLDPDLAAAHARFPFVATWDDHEVANNYMGDTRPDGADAAVVERQKAAAYRAWWEHMPTRLDPPAGPALAVYRDFDIGDLARFYLLDERQDAAVPPCRDTSTAGLDFGDCAEVEADRTRLGAEQEAWFTEAIGSSAATWNLVGNPVVLAGVDGGTDGDAYYLDTWDGYPEARKRFIATLAKADNPVVLTGDYHAGMVLDVHETPFDQSSPVVATELMAPPISSPLFSQDVSARTPQLRQQINAHGYLVVDVTPDALTARFRTLADAGDPASAIATEATWRIEAGDPTATKV